MTLPKHPLNAYQMKQQAFSISSLSVPLHISISESTFMIGGCRISNNKQVPNQSIVRPQTTLATSIKYERALSKRVKESWPFWFPKRVNSPFINFPFCSEVGRSFRFQLICRVPPVFHKNALSLQTDRLALKSVFPIGRESCLIIGTLQLICMGPLESVIV